MSNRRIEIEKQCVLFLLSNKYEEPLTLERKLLEKVFATDKNISYDGKIVNIYNRHWEQNEKFYCHVDQPYYVDAVKGYAFCIDINYEKEALQTLFEKTFERIESQITMYHNSIERSKENIEEKSKELDTLKLLQQDHG